MSGQSVTLALLGGFQVRRGGAMMLAADWERPRAAALVKLLAVEPGHRLHREQVLDALWPDLSPDSALASLRKALMQARRALEPELPPRGASRYLLSIGELLALSRETVSVDIDRFEQLAAAALAGVDIADYTAALNAYTGELLPEDRYADWASGRRESLASRYLEILMGLADLLSRQGRVREAIAALERALTADPWEETAHRRLMFLHARTGNRDAALRQYDRLSHALANELAAVPDQQTEALYGRILDGDIYAAEDRFSIPLEVVLPPPLRHAAMPPLVGREREVAVALEELRWGSAAESSAASPRPGIMLIGGEAGVGKTRVMIELGRRAHESGALLLWGGSHEEEGHAPYAPVVEALNAVLRHVPREQVGLLAERLPELRTVLPSWPVPDGTPPSGLGAAGAPDSFRLYLSIASLLRELAGPRPLLLLLDDLHTADAGTCQLVHHLARTAGDESCLIVATHRREDVVAESAFSRMARSLDRAALVRRIELGRLSADGTAQLINSLLLGGEAAPELVNSLYGYSLGNALYTAELVRELRARESVRLHDGQWQLRGDIPVPSRISGVIEARMTRLPEPAWQVLALAATIGSDIDPELLARAAGLPAGAIADAVDALLAAHLLEERGEGLAFPHPLIRSTVYAGCSQPRRRYLHGVVAGALEELRPADVEALAYHFAAARQREQAIVFLERSGDRAREVYALDTAAEQYAAALEFVADTSLEDTARLSSKRGDVLLPLGKAMQALAAFEGALSVYRELGDVEHEAVAVSQVADIEAGRDPRVAIEMIEQALAARENAGASRGLALLWETLGSALFGCSRYEDSLAASTRAIETARAAGATSVHLHALRAIASDCLMLGRLDEGYSALDEYARVANDLGKPDALAWIESDRGCLDWQAGKMEQGETRLAANVDRFRRLGALEFVGWDLMLVAVMRFHLGNWSQARRDVEEAYQVLEGASMTGSMRYVMSIHGLISAGMGMWEEAAAALDAALDMLRQRNDLQMLPWALQARAEIELLRGAPASAMALIEAYPLVDAITSPLAHATLAHAFLELGMLADAETALQRAWEQTFEQLPLIALETYRVQGMLEAARRCWTEATTWFDRTVSVARAISYPFAEGRALFEWGRMLAARSEPDAARERLLAAAEIFRRLSASPYLQRAESALASLQDT